MTERQTGERALGMSSSRVSFCAVGSTSPRLCRKPSTILAPRRLRIRTLYAWGARFCTLPPSAQPQPCKPFRRCDRDAVRRVAPRREPPLLNPNQTKAVSLAHGVADRALGHAGERRDVANRERARAVLRDLCSNHRKHGLLRQGEPARDLRRQTA